MATLEVATLLYMLQYTSNISYAIAYVKNSDSLLFNLCVNVLH